MSAFYLRRDPPAALLPSQSSFEVAVGAEYSTIALSTLGQGSCPANGFPGAHVNGGHEKILIGSRTPGTLEAATR
jgi:hypothetical protein